MKKTTLILSAFIAVLFIISCERETGAGETGTLTCNTEGVTYKDDIAPLFETRCNTSGCHASGSTYGDFTTYDNVKAIADEGDLKEYVLDQKTMPVGSTLSTDELDKVSCWLKDGYPNNGVGDTTSNDTTVTDTTVTDTTSNDSTVVGHLCDSLIPTYDAHVKRILDNSCVGSGCHGAGAGVGDYTTYATIPTEDLDSLGKIFNRVVTLKNMPIGRTMTQAERDTIECWINNGAREN